MLESVPFILFISSFFGFLAGIGVGGGSLLMLWLTLVLEIPHPTARVINLLFFIPSAIIASIFRWRQGTLNLKKIIPAIIAGCIAAFIFTNLSREINAIFLKKCFGFVLLFAGIFELFYRPTKPK